VIPIDLIAREFHETYEKLAPSHDYKTREESAVPWEDVPQANKSLMRSVIADLVSRGVIVPGANPLSRSVLEATGTTRDEHGKTG
jgi:hypothetical protein